MELDGHFQDTIEPLELLELLYENHPTELCKTLSKELRDNNHSKHSSLVYSEIDFGSFVDLIDLVKELGLLQPGGRFLDLGCGSGRAVFAAALGHSFDKALGVEILPGE